MLGTKFKYTAKNAKGAKITIATNSQRTHNELIGRVRTSSYKFVVLKT